MINRAQRQIVFEVFEGGFHFSQLNVKLPQFLGGSPARDVGPQKIASFPFAGLTQFVFAQGEGQFGFSGWHDGVNDSRRDRIIVQGRAQFLEQLVAFGFHLLQLFQPRPESF